MEFLIVVWMQTS